VDENIGWMKTVIMVAYTISINKCRSYLKRLVISNVCNKTLRSANNMQIPRFNTVTYGKQAMIHYAPLSWNSLSEDKKTSPTLSVFNQTIKLWYGVGCQCGFCVPCRINSQ